VDFQSVSRRPGGPETQTNISINGGPDLVSDLTFKSQIVFQNFLETIFVPPLLSPLVSPMLQDNTVLSPFPDRWSYFCQLSYELSNPAYPLLILCLSSALTPCSLSLCTIILSSLLMLSLITDAAVGRLYTPPRRSWGGPHW
jgi:hypothetical protein